MDEFIEMASHIADDIREHIRRALPEALRGDAGSVEFLSECDRAYLNQHTDLTCYPCVKTMLNRWRLIIRSWI